MMDSLRYLAVLAACFAITLPLEFGLGARVYRRPRRLMSTVGPVLLVFAVWDLAATARGHWRFNEASILGPRPLGLPIEEWLFFLIVPICAVLTYEALGSSRMHRAMARALARMLRRRRPGADRAA